MRKVLLTTITAIVVGLAGNAAHAGCISPRDLQFYCGHRLPVCENLLRQQKQCEQEQAFLQAAQKKAEEERRAREALERTPRYKLGTAYFSYLYVQACSEARQGYKWVWINDIELQRARAAAESVEQRFLKEDPNIDTTALYQEQARRGGNVLLYVDGPGCRAHYQSLLSQAPAPPPVKDFGKDAVEGD